MERKKSGQRIDSRLRIIGFVLGLAVAGSVVAASRFPAGAGVLGADVRMVVAPTGELAVKPTGTVLTGTALTPASDPVTGTLHVLNQTGSALDIHLRGITDAPGLDRTLWISVTGPGDEEVYRGALGGFRGWSDVGVKLRSGTWGAFHFEAWVPGDVGPGYAGRMAQVDLGFRVERANGS